MNIQKQIKLKEKELETLKEKLKQNHFIQIICKELNKEFRIYKWEDKSFKDFPIPKGFKWAKHSDFIYLYDNDLFKMEKYPSVYITENQSKKSIKAGWGVSRLYLAWDLLLLSGSEDLANSNDDGRVVVENELNNLKKGK